MPLTPEWYAVNYVFQCAWTPMFGRYVTVQPLAGSNLADIYIAEVILVPDFPVVEKSLNHGKD